jgi:hypothetical protein
VLAVTTDDQLVRTVMQGTYGHRGWVYYLAWLTRGAGAGSGRLWCGPASAGSWTRGIPKLQLMVRRDNEAAVAFYGPLGYKVVDVTVPRPSPRHPAWLASAGARAAPAVRGQWPPAATGPRWTWLHCRSPR